MDEVGVPLPPVIERIVSGGQTGGDQGVLLAGESLGIPTGGTAPHGWRTDEGPAPWLGTRFGLVEHGSSAYPPRTAANVFNSDGTLIFGNQWSQGCILTARLCADYKKPVLYVRWPDERNELERHAQRLREWIYDHKIRVLNGAGNRERSNPGIRDAVFWLVVEALKPGPWWDRVAAL